MTAPGKSVPDGGAFLASDEHPLGSEVVAGDPWGAERGDEQRGGDDGGADLGWRSSGGTDGDGVLGDLDGDELGIRAERLVDLGGIRVDDGAVLIPSDGTHAGCAAGVGD